MLMAWSCLVDSEMMPLNSAVVLTNGVASLTTSALTQGAHTISAEYMSDGNFYDTTISLPSSQVISTAAASASPANLLAINALSNGIVITFAGSPGYAYHVERTADLQGSNTVWQALGSTVANDAGQGQFTDTNPPQDRACYRLVWP